MAPPEASPSRGYLLHDPNRQTGAGMEALEPRHGSLHKDGVFHHKSFNRKFDPAQIIQKPDASWKGTKNLVTRPTPARDPRAFGEICVPAEFSEIMEIPVELLNPRTCVSVDVTDAKRVPTLFHPQTRVLAQRVFLEPPPHIVVTVQDPGATTSSRGSRAGNACQSRIPENCTSVHAAPTARAERFGRKSSWLRRFPGRQIPDIHWLQKPPATRQEQPAEDGGKNTAGASHRTKSAAATIGPAATPPAARKRHTRGRGP